MLMFTLISGSLLFCIIGKIWYVLQAGKCKSNSMLTGKTVIITGASAGIGKSAAYDLAKRGARLILACRNMEKASAVADEIKNTTGNKEIVVMKLDTSNLSSVRSFAEEFLKNEKSLHILINNAGIGGYLYRKMTDDEGHPPLEITMATNHYGHFLLTNILLGLMKSTEGDRRIINVSSIAHTFVKSLDPEDLNFEKMPYDSFQAYGQSKLCNVLFTLELSHKLKGTGITANSLHPGFVNTEIFGKLKKSLFTSFLRGIASLFGKSSDSGAQTTIYLAVAEELKNVTGKYFVDCKETKTSDLAAHLGFARKLWEASELDVNLQPEEIHY